MKKKSPIPLWSVSLLPAMALIPIAFMAGTAYRSAAIRYAESAASASLVAPAASAAPVAPDKPRSFVTKRMRVTAYCPCEKCCGKFSDGITASGKAVTYNGGKFVAAPPSFPFGTVMDIPGYGRVEVMDRGGKIKGDRLDVFFPTHQEALNWGVQHLEVQIYSDKLGV